MTKRLMKSGRIDKLVTFKITLEQYKRLELIAVEEGSPISTIIRHHIAHGIRAWEQAGAAVTMEEMAALEDGLRQIMQLG